MVTPIRLGHYELFDPIAVGGMASVHLGRMHGGAGFSRVVAIKRIHPHLARDREYVEMFLDEANLASKVRHPNVVTISDVVAHRDEVFLVMDYVPGMTVSELCRALGKGASIPTEIALRMICDALQGLHAVHTATDEDGRPLEIVHRDVSPDNLLVGDDGVTRVIDFGIAKGRGRIHRTQSGVMKGKLVYASPEQVAGDPLDCRTDVYSMGVTVWRMLTGEVPFADDEEAAVLFRKISGEMPRVSSSHPVSPTLDEAVARATRRERELRFASARDMLEAVEADSTTPAGAYAVGEWVHKMGARELGERAQRVVTVLSAPRTITKRPTTPARPFRPTVRMGVAIAAALTAAAGAYALLGVDDQADVAPARSFSSLVPAPGPVASPDFAAAPKPTAVPTPSAASGVIAAPPPPPPASPPLAPPHPVPPPGAAQKPIVPDRLLGRQ